MAKDFSDAVALERLSELAEPVEIKIFVAQGCPNCPHGVRAAEALAATNSMVTVSVVDTGESSELASRFQVRSVPTIVVNGELTIVGVVTQEELARRIIELQGPAADDAVFVSLVKSGRLDEVTTHLVDGRGHTAFAGLWNESTLESRIGLSLSAQNAIDEDGGCLDGLVEHLLPSLETDDAARRGDTADLLGTIGHASAKPALERLLGDSNPDVAEAAEDALASVEERTGAP